MLHVKKRIVYTKHAVSFIQGMNDSHLRMNHIINIIAYAKTSNEEVIQVISFSIVVKFSQIMLKTFISAVDKVI